MDLIKQLIDIKKNSIDYETTLTNILDEIIIYQKLRKSDKFTHIVESTLLQKKLPNIWDAYNENAEKLALFEKAINIVHTISTTPLEIYTDYLEHYKKRTRRQLEILGQHQQLTVDYEDLRELTTEQLTNSYLILTEKHENENLIAIIVFENKKQIKVYSGQYDTTEPSQKKKEIYEPLHVTINEDTIVIDTYSIQGNNDYIFGTYNNEPMSFPEQNLLQIGAKQIELTKEELQRKTLEHNNPKKLVQFFYDLYHRQK